jgi:hypothetical protein
MLTPNLCHPCSLSPPPNCSKSPQPPSQNQSNSLQRLCWSRTPPCTQRIRERRRRAHRPRRIRRHIIRNADAVFIAQLYTGTWTFPFSKNILTQTNGDQGLTILQHHGVPGHESSMLQSIFVLEDLAWVFQIYGAVGKLGCASVSKEARCLWISLQFVVFAMPSSQASGHGLFGLIVGMSALSTVLKLLRVYPLGTPLYYSLVRCGRLPICKGAMV